MRSVLFLASIPAAAPISSARDEPRVVTVEMVTDQAATGDGGNSWGGHQCRIVRTRDGVFTAFTVPGRDELSREWCLAWRGDAVWKLVARGPSGREPVNLLASPDGTLHIIGWPGGKARHWSGRPSGAKIVLQESEAPGLSDSHWPYGSAGINAHGRLCVVSSEGEKPGVLRWSTLDPANNTWSSGFIETDYRHCYTYVFPDANGGLSLVSNRDVKWETLGYKIPKDAFAYVFNSFGYWHTPDLAQSIPVKLASFEESPTKDEPMVICNAQSDAYMDTKGHIHILSHRLGSSTRGIDQLRYSVLSSDGRLLKDEVVPWSAGPMCRIFQDDRGQFCLLGSDGVIYSGGTDTVSFKNKTKLHLGGYMVKEPGFSISAPRGGSPPGKMIDAVFPANWGEKWIYCRIQLRGDS